MIRRQPPRRRASRQAIASRVAASGPRGHVCERSAASEASSSHSVASAAAVASSSAAAIGSCAIVVADDDATAAALATEWLHETPDAAERSQTWSLGPDAATRIAIACRLARRGGG